MTTPIDKLIADAKWQKIDEAPENDDDGVYDNGTYLGTGSDRKRCGLYRGKWGAYRCGETHFRPIPDDRCAEALEVAVEALEAIAKGELLESTAKEALQQINDIAGGERG